MNTLKIGALIGATLCITAGAASAQDAGDTIAWLDNIWSKLRKRLPD